MFICLHTLPPSLHAHVLTLATSSKPAPRGRLELSPCDLWTGTQSEFVAEMQGEKAFDG
jgi:hypothetical protein